MTAGIQLDMKLQQKTKQSHPYQSIIDLHVYICNEEHDVTHLWLDNFVFHALPQGINYLICQDANLLTSLSSLG